MASDLVFIVEVACAMLWLQLFITTCETLCIVAPIDSTLCASTKIGPPYHTPRYNLNKDLHDPSKHMFDKIETINSWQAYGKATCKVNMRALNFSYLLIKSEREDFPCESF